MKKIRKLAVLLLALLILLPVLPVKGRADDRVESMRDSGDYGSIHWEIWSIPSAVWEGYDWVLKVSGKGAIPDFDHPNDGCAGDILPPWMRCRWTYYEEYAEAGVEPDPYQKSPYFEGMGCFDGAYLDEIIIEPGITEIGKYAFRPATFQCSYGSSTIEEIVIPDTVKRIGEGAFDGWSYITRAVVPDSVTELDGSYIFKPSTKIVCSSGSAAYRYAQKVECPVELTDLKLSLTITGKSDPVSLSKGDKVSYQVTSNIAGVTPEIFVSDSSLLQLDTDAHTVTVTGDGGTGTLYAQAQGKKASVEINVKRQYTITYFLDGGKNNAKNPLTYTEGKTVKLKSPTKKGYKFLGWYRSYYGTEKTTSVKDGNAYVYARWKQVTVPTVQKLKLTTKKTRKVQVSFKKVDYAKGYLVQYATKPTFPSGSRKTKSTAKNSLTLTSLKKNKTYYVRVRAWKKDSAGKKVYGVWCDPVKIKIKK